MNPAPDPVALAPWVGLAIGALAVLARPIWVRVRGLVTIAHEGGHALVAVLVGRRLAGIRLHSDTSGLTVSSGPPRGPGMVAMLLAGYPAPALVGVVAGLFAAADRERALLAALAVVLLGMLAVIRNVVGFAGVLLTSVVLTACAVVAPGWVQVVAGHALSWVLLLGAVRAVVDLHLTRRGRLGLTSDADQLATLTRTPGVLWVVAFALVNAAGLLAGSWLLLLAPAAPLPA